MQYQPSTFHLLSHPNRITLYHSKHGRQRLSHSEPNPLTSTPHHPNLTKMQPTSIKNHLNPNQYLGPSDKTNKALENEFGKYQPHPQLFRISHQQQQSKGRKIRRNVIHRPVKEVNNEFSIMEAQIQQKIPIKKCIADPPYDYGRTALRYHGAHRIFETTHKPTTHRDVTPPLSPTRGTLTAAVSSAGYSQSLTRSRPIGSVKEGSLEYSFEEGEAVWGKGGKELREGEWLDLCEL